VLNTRLCVAQTEMKFEPPGTIRRFTSRNDHLLVLRNFHNSPEAGAVLGMELGRVLDAGKLRQAEAECLLFGRFSQFPFVQTVTDLRKGGAVFCSRGRREGSGELVIEGRIIIGMEEFWEAVRQVALTVPENVGTFDGAGNVVLPQHLEDREYEDGEGPGRGRRKRFKVSMMSADGGGATNLRGALSLGALARLAAGCLDEDDVGRLEDLEDFELGGGVIAPWMAAEGGVARAQQRGHQQRRSESTRGLPPPPSYIC
jgi:hypothetical protein